MSILRNVLLVCLLLSTAEAFTGSARGRAPTKAPAKKAPASRARTPAKKAPAKKAVVKKAPVKKAPAPVRRSGFSPTSDVGVTPPLGLFDPLGFLNRGPAAYRRYQEMEIKHGRFCMAACLGVIVTEAGIKFPGYISLSQDLKFADVPGSLEGAYFGIPLAGWVQIVAFIGALDIAVFRQDPAYPAGDVVQDLPIEWVRYSDPTIKTFKLNAERNNGRAAMLGILGMISHAALGEDALFPIVSS